MRKILLYLFIVLLCPFASCKKSSLIMYQDDPRVYFYKYGRASNQDILPYSFAFKDVNIVKDTVYLQLRIMGDTTNYDREVNIMVDDSSTAVENEDFAFGPKIIHAGLFADSIPVYLFKTPKMDTSVLNLNMTIGESKDFKPGYVDNGWDLTATGSRLNFAITITNQLQKPTIWDNQLVRYFGTYSRVKFQFIIVVSGISDWSSAPYPATLTFVVQQVKAELLQYQADNGHPLLDENGNEVTIP